MNEATPAIRAPAPKNGQGGVTIFWLEDGMPRHMKYISSEMGASMKLMEALRQNAAAGSDICHVCMSTEFENSIGKAGVSDALPADYDWSKQHRANPFGSLRRADAQSK